MFPAIARYITRPLNAFITVYSRFAKNGKVPTEARVPLLTLIYTVYVLCVPKTFLFLRMSEIPAISNMIPGFPWRVVSGEADHTMNIFKEINKH